MKSEKVSFSLNSKVLKDIPFQKYENNFIFDVNGRRYSTSRIVADLLSPNVRNLHYKDETIQEYFIDNKYIEEGETKINNEADDFSNFLKLCTFEPIQLDERERKLYSAYFYQLGNIEAFFQLQPELLLDLNSDNVVEILLKIENIDKNSLSDNNEYINKIISFITTHFEEIEPEKLKQLPIESLERIIGSKSLEITDEDSLLDFVLNLYQENRQYSVLFEYILFCNVSDEKLKKFVNDFFVEDINKNIWLTVCNRFFSTDENNGKEKNEEVFRKYKKSDKEFTNTEGKEFEGIMKFLTRETGGNIHDNGTIEITSNSISSHPKNLVDYENNDNYYYPAGNDRDAFACFDFKDKQIQLSSYSIKSWNADPNNKQLRSWAIQVSNDGQHWEEVDRHDNYEKLNGKLITATFKISPKRKEFYRYIRILETGICWKSSNDRYDGIIGKIEFFGKLHQPKKE